MSTDKRPVDDDVAAEVERLRRRCRSLETVIASQERQLSAAAKLVARVRRLDFWDHSVYDLVPDDTWLCVDRSDALALLSALGEIDHWHPWQTRVEGKT